jgi:hypothetical protein
MLFIVKLYHVLNKTQEQSAATAGRGTGRRARAAVGGSWMDSAAGSGGEVSPLMSSELILSHPRPETMRRKTTERMMTERMMT